MSIVVDATLSAGRHQHVVSDAVDFLSGRTFALIDIDLLDDLLSS